MSRLSYPLDLTGLAGTNLITNESHVLTSLNHENYATLVPLFTPFFSADAELTHVTSVERRVLTKGIDYYEALPFHGLSRSTNQVIHSAFVIINRALNGEIVLRYRTVGGVWTSNRGLILERLAEKNYNPRMTSWEYLFNLPDCYPPQDHFHNASTFYNTQALVDAILALKVAIEEQPNDSIITRHIANKENPHETTLQQLGYSIAADTELSSGLPSDHLVLLNHVLAYILTLSGGPQ